MAFPTALVALAGLVLGVLPRIGTGGEPLEVDSIMNRDPVIENPELVRIYPQRLKPLWVAALGRPETELKRLAATSIALAEGGGMAGLGETAGPLMRVLDDADQPPVVRRAAAGALVALDARQAAALLMKRAAEHLELAQIAEPALARWDYVPVRAVWLRRLEQPNESRRRTILAMRGLATVGETGAAGRLLDLAIDANGPADLRLEAARAVARLQTSGLEAPAEKLKTRRTPAALLDRLVAATLLAHHESEAAIAVLTDSAVDPQAAVAIVALGHLFELDPKLVLPLVDRTIGSGDAKIRGVVARTLAACPSPERIARLGPMLDDPHPQVRRFVQSALAELAARPELRPAVTEQVEQMLGTDHWRGLEQAIFVAVALDDEPACDRIVELLDFTRPEVFIAAAWALGRLAVPRTRQAMLAKLQRETERKLGGEYPYNRVDEQLAQLAQSLGMMKYVPADAVLRHYIPKGGPFDSPARSAAIWALGHLHADRPDAALAKALAGRLADVEGMMPEAFDVRTMSAISLGRMKAEDTLDTLRRFRRLETPQTACGYACGWAIHQITGEAIPRVEPKRVLETNWFLVPSDAPGAGATRVHR